MRKIIPLLALLFIGLGLYAFGPTSPPATVKNHIHPTMPAFLPPEAADTLQRIAQGGPFKYHQDGSVFSNRERRLPAAPHGYYHEYTVETPGLHYRGAKRIITGGTPPTIFYYTDNHYRSFRAFHP